MRSHLAGVPKTRIKSPKLSHSQIARQDANHPSPNKYDFQDVERMTLSNTTYSFKQLAEDKIELTIDSKFSAVGPVTRWMLNSWLPGGPAGLVNRLIKQVKEAN